ncbi:MAG: hypothetical protein JRI87_01275, partial [Deltaproteobacteria bacterium]|nr:hypothetical protein [Deltaproteobacteria bacterium]
SITFGKSSNNGWGAYNMLWASHTLMILFGALEVPGSHIGSRALLTGGDLQPGEDGFLYYKVHPTDKANWKWPPETRCGHTTITPLSGDMPYLSVVMGASPLSWINMTDPLDKWPATDPPDLYFTYKSNPVMGNWEPERIMRGMEKMFVVKFAYELDETSEFSDILLPDSIDLESTQVMARGGAIVTFFEYLLDHIGFVARSPAIDPPFNTKEMTDICTELADRSGMLAEYNQIINMGGAFFGVALKEEYHLDPKKKYTATEIYDRIAKSFTEGNCDLEWFKEHGGTFKPFPKTEGMLLSPMPGAWMRPFWLHKQMVEKGLRYQLPYQEKLMRTSRELKRRLNEKEIHWWDKQTEPYKEGIPDWEDVFAEIFDTGPEYDLWAIATRSAQSVGGSASLPITRELTEKITGHRHVLINKKAAGKRGIKDDDEIWIESAYKKKIKARAKLIEGVHIETIVFVGQLGRYTTPTMKDSAEEVNNINFLIPIDIKLTDETGAQSDHVRVKVYKA